MTMRRTFQVTGDGEEKYLIATSEQPMCAYHLGNRIHPDNCQLGGSPLKLVCPQFMSTITLMENSFFPHSDMLVTPPASEKKLVHMDGTQLASSECTSLKRLSNSVLQAQMATIPGKCLKR